jgi:hypothetical protein
MKYRRGVLGIVGMHGIGKCGVKERKEERLATEVTAACNKWLRKRGLLQSMAEIKEIEKQIAIAKAEAKLRNNLTRVKN